MNLYSDIEPWQWWLIAALALFIFEIFTPGFVLACIGVACLLGILPALVGLSLAWQIVFFVMGSVLSLIFLRPFILKISKRRGSLHTPTGTDALIGRLVQVRERIDPQNARGRVSVDGDSWRATTADGRCVEARATVCIVGRDSLVLIVMPVDNLDEQI